MHKLTKGHCKCFSKFSWDNQLTIFFNKLNASNNVLN